MRIMVRLRPMLSMMRPVTRMEEMQPSSHSDKYFNQKQGYTHLQGDLSGLSTAWVCSIMHHPAWAVGLVTVVAIQNIKQPNLVTDLICHSVNNPLSLWL